MTASVGVAGIASRVGDVRVNPCVDPRDGFDFRLEVGEPGTLTVLLTPEALNGLFADCAAHVAIYDADQRDRLLAPIPAEPWAEDIEP